ncbi:C18orf8_2 [Blepharisma stoltei]|uniref:Mic1 domain-containing protein n=1 Tax=Blepharisma stoltei TaxID=1481888 RepID=A0AAU9IWH7_9CILI|nr:unnamed protein product [Blepharisma stoltei]
MEFEAIESWELQPDTEVFYNSSVGKFYYKNHHIITGKLINTLETHPLIELPSLDQKIIAMSMTNDDRIIAVQRVPHELDLISVDTLQTLTIAGGINRKILGFHWVKGIASLCDLVMITSAGIEFYKVTEKPFRVSNVRGYQFGIAFYWFEPKSGVIAAACSAPNLGKIRTFFLYQNKGTKFQGNKIIIDISPFTTDIWTTMPLNSSNLFDFYSNVYEDNINQIALISIYDGVYFIHINCIKGSLVVYKLEYEELPEIAFNLSISSGKYGIRSSDNLLILQNYDTQACHIFDIKSFEYSSRPIVTISCKEDLENREQFNSFALNHSKTQYIYYDFLLDWGLKYIDNDLCIDMNRKLCFKLNLKPEVLMQKHPSSIEAILFLLRRKGCKNQAFEFLKDSLRNKIELIKLGFFFNTLNKVYKIAAIERKKSNKDDKRPSLPSLSSFESYKPGKYIKRTSLQADVELKINSGMTVILQTDMHKEIFAPLYRERLDFDYLTKVILLYNKSLIDEDIQVHQVLQILLAKVLIESQNFVLLQQLFEHNMFNDNGDFANLMIELSKGTNSICYPPAFQIGIDMLYRLESYGALAEAFLNNGMIFEALQLLEKHPCPGFDVKLIQPRADSYNDPQLSLFVSQYINSKRL